MVSMGELDCDSGTAIYCMLVRMRICESRMNTGDLWRIVCHTGRGDRAFALSMSKKTPTAEAPLCASVQVSSRSRAHCAGN